MIRFSVIIPFHNTATSPRGDYLDELLDSLPDRDDLEVLVVDDHSPLPYVGQNRFLHTDLRIVENTPGQRYAGAARNHGMALARGAWLIFADSDDRFDAAALADLLERFDELPDADLYLARSTSFREDGTPGRRDRNTNAIIDTFEVSGSTDDLIRYHSPWGKVVSRKHIERYGLTFGHSRVANDVLFGVALALSFPRVQVLESPLYQIREGNPSLTSDVSAASARARIEVAREVHRLLLAAGKGELRAPLHYHLRRYASSHPRVAFGQLVRAALRGERIVSPPWKMLKTALRRHA